MLTPDRSQETRERFAALFSQLSPRLYRTALGLVGNPHDAADALQEAGLKAYRYFHTLQHSGAASAWFTRILVGVCHDQGRKRSRLVPSGLEVFEDQSSPPMAETDWELMQALQQLPPEQRTTVVLRFFQDLSLPQIAAVTNVPEGTVKSRLHTALSKLRQVLAESRKEGIR